MPKYAIRMGQAIVTTLNANTSLATGVLTYREQNMDWPDLVTSCSAVIFFNPDTKKTGLYHYPAGELHANPSCKQLFLDMKREVRPEQIYVYFGHSGPGGEQKLPTDERAQELRSYLRSFAPVVQYKPIQSGIIIVSLKGNKLAFGFEYDGESRDLSNFGRTSFGSGEEKVEIFQAIPKVPAKGILAKLRRAFS